MTKTHLVQVFATDVDGLHETADAQRAVEQWGALAGIGEGPSGSSYAIPVYDREGKIRPIEQMRGPIRRFLEYANKKKRTTFYVPRLGCTFMGYDDFDIAPYFTNAPEHVILPSGWRTYYQDYRNKV